MNYYKVPYNEKSEKKPYGIFPIIKRKFQCVECQQKMKIKTYADFRNDQEVYTYSDNVKCNCGGEVKMMEVQ